MPLLLLPLLALTLSNFSYVIGAIGLALLGFVGRMMWTGVKESVVKAVVDSSLKDILGGMVGNIQDIKEDLKDIKTGNGDIRARMSQGAVELDALRRRFDAHMEIAGELDDDYSLYKERNERFRERVETFMKWAESFLKEHTHMPSTPTASSVGETPAKLDNV